jgi:polar amino acid transport system ATP-binding protein
MISVERLEKRKGGKQILRNISFLVDAGSVLGIVGASGSGKTTLLRCLNGLDHIDSGQLQCAGVTLEATLPRKSYWRRASELRRQVGTVFQHLHLFPHLSVLGNIVEAPVHVLHRVRAEAETEAQELLHLVGLAEAASRYPESLSGGEQQRVAIARALAMHPQILLFDEPTSALDPKRSADLRSLLRSFVTRGHTLVIVSHAIGFLQGLSDNLLYMEGGEVVEQGPTVQILQSPRDPRTRDFVMGGAGNLSG